MSTNLINSADYSTRGGALSWNDSLLRSGKPCTFCKIPTQARMALNGGPSVPAHLECALNIAERAEVPCA